MSELLSRRSFLGSAALAGAVAPAASPLSFHVPPRRRAQHPVAVSSRNGLKAVEIAVQKMKEGLPPVDAAVLGVEPVENDPEDTSVGYGGLPNADGEVELDSCVMDGRSGLAGAVAALKNIKNPAQVALKVMRRTDHVLLVGEGALRFARMHGFVEENLLTERARKEWVEWRERLSKEDDWVDPQENGALGKEYVRQTGTIHVGCVDANGDIGGCTTTSGLAFKIPGRVGDSPLIGCGNYVDNEYGVAGSTGRGEAVILCNGAHRVVRYLADGRTPTDACLAALTDLVRFTKVKRLLREDGKPDFQVNLYAVNKRGEIGAAALYPSRHARCDENGPRLVDSAVLFA
ncbi:MAG: N(4)-(beta-N-acetylglucosaminyl)-L-asparaginase [Planctomycetes bacterium]|nr:N(4)-(beta-N-acetylglucosaminyl)-L-asparaginase [Planctomycetota bacterium]